MFLPEFSHELVNVGGLVYEILPIVSLTERIGCKIW